MAGDEVDLNTVLNMDYQQEIHIHLSALRHIMTSQIGKQYHDINSPASLMLKNQVAEL